MGNKTVHRGEAADAAHSERAKEIAKCMDAMQSVAESHGIKSVLITVKDPEGLAAHAINNMPWDDAFRLSLNLTKEICDDAAGEMLKRDMPSDVIEFFMQLKREAAKLSDSFGERVNDLLKTLKEKSKV